MGSRRLCLRRTLPLKQVRALAQARPWAAAPAPAVAAAAAAGPAAAAPSAARRTSRSAAAAAVAASALGSAGGAGAATATCLCVAPSRLPDGGAGVFAICDRCSPRRHRAARDRSALLGKSELAWLKLGTDHALNCPNIGKARPAHEAPVVRSGDVVGYYWGRACESDHVGSYVLFVSSSSAGAAGLSTAFTSDASKRGSILRFMNGAETEAGANVAFAGPIVVHAATGLLMVPVKARRDIFSHAELIVFYGPHFKLQSKSARVAARAARAARARRGSRDAALEA